MGTLGLTICQCNCGWLWLRILSKDVLQARLSQTKQARLSQIRQYILIMKTKALTYWNLKKVKNDKNKKKTNWKNWRDKKKQMKNTLCRRRTSGKNKAWKKTILVYSKVWFQQAPNIFNAEWVGVGRLWGNPPDTIRQPPIGSGGGGVTPVSFFSCLSVVICFFFNLFLDSQYLEESGSHNNHNSIDEYVSLLKHNMKTNCRTF